MIFCGCYTHEKNEKVPCPLKRNHFKRKIVSQPSIFRGHGRFRGSSFFCSAPFSTDHCSDINLNDTQSIPPEIWTPTMKDWSRKTFFAPGRLKTSQCANITKIFPSWSLLEWLLYQSWSKTSRYHDIMIFASGTYFYILRIFQHIAGTYPRPPTNSLWRSSFHLGLRGCLGYAPGVCWGSLRYILNKKGQV